ncbi:MAG: hypothetical protein ABR907_17390, partial [Terracidiphilus sp.]
MKTRILLAAASMLLLASTPVAQATPNCVTGSLASYILLGAGGCLFDGALYNNFSYAAVSTNGVSAANITVEPAILPMPNLQQGLNFLAKWNVAAGVSEQSVIGFNVVPFPPVATPSTGVLILDLGPSTVSGIIGSVTVTEKTTGASTISPLEVYDICADA